MGLIAAAIAYDTAMLRLPCIILLCLATSLLLLMSGCAAPVMVVTAGVAAAQAGSSAYVNGELRAARQATLEQTWEATLAALDELELNVLHERISERSRYVMAKDTRGPEFKITFERKSPVATRIGIRIGVLGDVAVSRLTLRVIDQHLAEIAAHRHDRVDADDADEHDDAK